MAVVNVHEAKTHLSRLLEAVSRGESVTIARAGRPIADLVPHREATVVIGALEGRLTYDEDFDAPEPAILEMFGLR